jgi:phage I-like protein
MNATRRAFLSANVVALSLSADGSASTEQVIIPAGEFSAPDGRPGTDTGGKVKSWKNGPKQFAVMEAAAKKVGRPICVDYEHALVKKQPLGEKTIAAGWVDVQAVALSYDPARGTVARIDWTPAAAEHIRNKELAYLSPVFFYDNEGNVASLHSIALTNNPALSQLAVAALSAEFSALAGNPHPNAPLPGEGEHLTNNEGDTVNLAVALRAALSLPETTTEESLLTHVAALSTATPNPTEYCSMATLTAEQAAHADTRNKLAALTAQVNTATLDGYIKDATEAGAVLTAEFTADVRKIAETMGLDVAKRQLDALPRAAALANKSQTQGKPAPAAAGSNMAALTDSQRSMARLTGVTDEEYAAELARLTTA